jgi:hypothetical protein
MNNVTIAMDPINAPQKTYIPWILIGGITMVLLLIGFGVYQWIQYGSWERVVDWWYGERPREERRHVTDYRPESWCFVGEDVEGRWCVRVPNPQSCTPDRLFDSEDSCTYVPASAMPLGVVREGGAEYKPFAPPMPAMANTF